MTGWDSSLVSLTKFLNTTDYFIMEIQRPQKVAIRLIPQAFHYQTHGCVAFVRHLIRILKSRGSTLVVDLVDCTSKRETKLVLSLPPPECPSNTNAQPDVLPGYPVGEGDPTVTNEPVNKLQDPSSTRKHNPSEPEPELETAGREKEPQLEYSHFFI